jgi:hypothetical protein
LWKRQRKGIIKLQMEKSDIRRRSPALNIIYITIRVHIVVVQFFFVWKKQDRIEQTGSPNNEQGTPSILKNRNIIFGGVNKAMFN